MNIWIGNDFFFTGLHYYLLKFTGVAHRFNSLVLSLGHILWMITKVVIDLVIEQVVDKLQSDGKSKREGWKTELPSMGLGTSVLEKMREEKRNDAVWQGKCSGTVYVSNLCSIKCSILIIYVWVLIFIGGWGSI